MKPANYVKAIAATILTFLAQLELALGDDIYTRKEFVHGLVAALTIGWGIYLIPNKPMEGS